MPIKRLEFYERSEYDIIVRKEAPYTDMATIIAVVCLIAVVSWAISYIVKEKKKGNACIGCPYSSACSKYSCSHTSKKNANMNGSSLHNDTQ